jgi:hypothetical protein
MKKFNKILLFMVTASSGFCSDKNCADPYEEQKKEIFSNEFTHPLSKTLRTEFKKPDISSPDTASLIPHKRKILKKNHPFIRITPLNRMRIEKNIELMVPETEKPPTPRKVSFSIENFSENSYVMPEKEDFLTTNSHSQGFPLGKRPFHAEDKNGDENNLTKKNKSVQKIPVGVS